MRLLFRQAADRGALTAEEALRLASVPNVKQGGQRLGQWLVEAEAGKLLGVPDPKTRIGVWDRALLALLVACGLRRDELARLEVGHLQLRDERWVLLDMEGKGRRIRTVPVPLWVKRLLDRWLEAGEITRGPLFRPLRKGGALGPGREADQRRPDLYLSPAERSGHRASRFDAARSAADLRQIMPEGGRGFGTNTIAARPRLHPNPERYLGTKQDLVQAVNDRVKIRVE
ncbi:MAG: tyrosine-type recombinase/integrase [Acidobacteriota bacterium]|nr:tyrosine-type recombinase/integrase [Acidobacteriota bacterium]